MALNRGPHVRELFIGHQAAIDYDEKEKKKVLNFGKKNKAPLHPKLGAYKPKILSEDKAGNIAINSSSQQNISDRNSQQGGKGKINKAFVIGDKDVPMVLEPQENIYSEIDEPIVPVSAAVKIREQTTTGINEQTTTNPLFTDSPGQSNPNYRNNANRQTSPRSVVCDTINEEIEGVAIPPPDYEEDELTLDLSGEDVKGMPVYREFAGEDYSQFLTDDEEDYEFDHPAYSVRSKSAVNRKILHQKSKTETWRANKQKRDASKSIFKQNPKNRGKSTLRHFSVNDSKLGIGIDGSSKKQDKPSIRNGVNYNSSYESFLQTRNGGPRWGSVESASSDSGHETGDDVIKNQKKSPFWKKLTVRIKTAGYNITH